MINTKVLKEKIEKILTRRCIVGCYYNVKESKNKNFFLPPENLKEALDKVDAITKVYEEAAKSKKVSEKDNNNLLKKSLSNLKLKFDYSKATNFSVKLRFDSDVITLNKLINIENLIYNKNQKVTNGKNKPIPIKAISNKKDSVKSTKVQSKWYLAIICDKPGRATIKGNGFYKKDQNIKVTFNPNCKTSWYGTLPGFFTKQEIEKYLYDKAKEYHVNQEHLTIEQLYKKN